MIRRKLTVLVMFIMSLNLVACSNTDNTQISKEQIEENTVSSEINKEKEALDTELTALMEKWEALLSQENS